MPRETEIKLTIRAQDLVAVHGWLKDLGAESDGARDLENIYFDTPDLVLNQHQVALRIRRVGRDYIQTLKTRGQAVGGVHRREEWEWPVAGPELETLHLREARLPLTASQWEGLEPVFATNFQRETWTLRHNGAEVECALDQGQVEARGRRRPLFEVEFELRQGPESSLLSLAREIAARIPLLVNGVSKAEQGYHLAGHYHPDLIMPGAAAPAPVDGLNQSLSLYWLTGQSDQLLAAWGWLNQLVNGAANLGEDRAWTTLVDRIGAHLVSSATGEPFALLDEPLVGRLQLALLGAEL